MWNIHERLVPRKYLQHGFESFAAAHLKIGELVSRETEGRLIRKIFPARFKYETHLLRVEKSSGFYAFTIKRDEPPEYACDLVHRCLGHQYNKRACHRFLLIYKLNIYFVLPRTPTDSDI
jgi:hypothetical protein